MSNRFISWDLLFSWWVLVWFFIYMIASFFTKENELCKFIYENTNPLFLFLIAILSSFKNLFLIMIYNPQLYIIVTYITKFVFMKLIPIIYLCYQKIKPIENIIFSLFAFFLYTIYLVYKKESMSLIYNDLTQSIIDGKSNTSLEKWIRL